MEVFIREKNCKTCPFANKERPNFICGDAIANDIGLKTNFSVCKLSYFANEESCPLKSLEQHDAELKAKWCEDLLKWINTPYTIGCAMCLNREGFLQTDDLKQKLQEMKGE